MPYLGEIQLVAFDFAPLRWMPCEGQLVPISEFESLFNLIGTTFGGDGMETFALPDLRGRTPVGSDNDSYAPGKFGGADWVTLTEDELPSHTHTPSASSADGNTKNVNNNLLGSGQKIYSQDRGAAAHTSLAKEACEAYGKGEPHPNMQPYLPMRWIICIDGIFPA
jgi:microcystin-dependent protein